MFGEDAERIGSFPPTRPAGVRMTKRRRALRAEDVLIGCFRRRH